MPPKPAAAPPPPLMPPPPTATFNAQTALRQEIVQAARERRDFINDADPGVTRARNTADLRGIENILQQRADVTGQIENLTEMTTDINTRILDDRKFLKSEALRHGLISTLDAQLTDDVQLSSKLKENLQKLIAGRPSLIRVLEELGVQLSIPLNKVIRAARKELQACVDEKRSHKEQQAQWEEDKKSLKATIANHGTESAQETQELQAQLATSNNEKEDLRRKLDGESRTLQQCQKELAELRSQQQTQVAIPAPAPAPQAPQRRAYPSVRRVTFEKEWATLGEELWKERHDVVEYVNEALAFWYDELTSRQKDQRDRNQEGQKEVIDKSYAHPDVSTRAESPWIMTGDETREDLRYWMGQVAIVVRRLRTYVRINGRKADDSESRVKELDHYVVELKRSFRDEEKRAQKAERDLHECQGEHADAAGLLHKIASFLDVVHRSYLGDLRDYLDRADEFDRRDGHQGQAGPLYQHTAERAQRIQSILRDQHGFVGAENLIVTQMNNIFCDMSGIQLDLFRKASKLLEQCWKDGALKKAKIDELGSVAENARKNAEKLVSEEKSKAEKKVSELNATNASEKQLSDAAHEHAIADLNKDIGTKDKEIKRLGAEHVKCKSDKDGLSGTITELRTKAENLQSEVAKQTALASSSGRQVDELKVERDSLQNVKTEKISFETNFNNANRQLADCNKAKQELQQKVNEKQDLILSLEKKVVEVNTQLAAQGDASTEVGTLRNQLEEQRNQHSQALDKCRNDKGKVDSELSELKIKITQVESNLKIARESKDKCQSDLSTAQSDLMTAKSERDVANDNLQKEVATVQELQKNASDRSNQFDAEKSRANGLATELAECRQSSESVVNDKDAAVANLKGAQQLLFRVIRQPVDALPDSLHQFSSIIRRFKELESLQGSSMAVTAPTGWDNLQFDYHPVDDPTIAAIRMWYQMTSPVHGVEMVYHLEPDLRILAILEDAVHNQLLKPNWTSETVLAWLRAVEYLSLCYRTDRLKITFPEVTDILHAALIRRIQDPSKPLGAHIKAESMDVAVKLILYGQDLIVVDGDYTRVVGRANFALIYPAMDGFFVVRNYRDGQEGRWLVDETDQVIREKLARLFSDACDRSDEGNLLYDFSGGEA